MARLATVIIRSCFLVIPYTCLLSRVTVLLWFVVAKVIEMHILKSIRTIDACHLRLELASGLSDVSVRSSFFWSLECLLCSCFNGELVQLVVKAD